MAELSGSCESYASWLWDEKKAEFFLTQYRFPNSVQIPGWLAKLHPIMFAERTASVFCAPNLSGVKILPMEFRWRTNAKFEEVAFDLGKAINIASIKTGNKKVHIVAYSFGGLLAPTYLQGLNGLLGDVGIYFCAQFSCCQAGESVVSIGLYSDIIDWVFALNPEGGNIDKINNSLVTISQSMF